MVSVLSKESFCRIEARRAQPLDSDPGALLDQIKHSHSDARAAARIGEIDCFSDDVIGDYQSAPRSKHLFHNGPCGRMICILLFDERIQT